MFHWTKLLQRIYERLFRLIFAIQGFLVCIILGYFVNFLTFPIMNHYCRSWYVPYKQWLWTTWDTIDVYYSKGTYVLMHVPPASFHVRTHVPPYSYVLLHICYLYCAIMDKAMYITIIDKFIMIITIIITQKIAINILQKSKNYVRLCDNGKHYI